jgi:hypothetical protein
MYVNYEIKGPISNYYNVPVVDRLFIRGIQDGMVMVDISDTTPCC